MVGACRVAGGARACTRAPVSSPPRPAPRTPTTAHHRGHGPLRPTIAQEKLGTPQEIVPQTIMKTRRCRGIPQVTRKLLGVAMALIRVPGGTVGLTTANELP